MRDTNAVTDAVNVKREHVFKRMVLGTLTPQGGAGGFTFHVSNAKLHPLGEYNQ